MDPGEFGIPETRNRTFYPYFSYETEEAKTQCEQALLELPDVIDRMKATAAPMSLADVLYPNATPLIMQWQAKRMPYDKPEVLMPDRKKTKCCHPDQLDARPEKTEPTWYNDHRQAYQKIGIKWVHPDRNASLIAWARDKPTVQSLPPRERCLCYLMHVAAPHEGDFMDTDPLEKYDEQTVELSQEVIRCQWNSGNAQCLTRGSVVYLRFHKRLMHGSEKLRLHGFYAPDDTVAWHQKPSNKLNTIAGLSFNGFAVCVLYLAMWVVMPQCVVDAIANAEDA